ncbi:MAG: transcription elongation factor GreB [Archangium sp.]|nr:transcription elongation factor GreB [Archangium sp.]
MSPKPLDQEEQIEDPEDLAEDDEPRQAGTLYITRAGAERLRAELKHLLTVERPKVTAEVSFAASLGDRSENAEYIYGKKRLREIDRRLRFLDKRLEKLTVVEPGTHKDSSKIFFGATVSLENEEDGSKVTYQLVGPDETDLKTGKISVDSPVGKALLGKKAGDVVTVNRPKGEVDFAVVAIKYV